MNNSPLTILVAEDVVATQNLLRQFLTRFGHIVLIADNGQQAVELFQEHQPDIILCDVNMPVMNGLEAIEKIRTLSDSSWVPILILSASDQDNDIVTGLESGADDYLSKPINLKVLNAKIGAMQRFVTLQKTNIKNKKVLQSLHDEFEHEQLLAKNIADKMLARGQLDYTNIEYWLQPNRYFSGDLIAASQPNENKVFIMLADSTGHGLGAALPILTLSRTFHAMTQKHFTLSEIVSEINSSLKAILTADRFIACNIFEIDLKHKSIEAWCGGIPNSLLLNEVGDTVHQFKSKHLALGILPPSVFDSSTEVWKWEQAVELIAFSDGVTEAESPEGIPFGEDKLFDILSNATSPKSRVSMVKKAVLSHLNAEQGQDDISLVSIHCE